MTLTDTNSSYCSYKENLEKNNLINYGLIKVKMYDM